MTQPRPARRALAFAAALTLATSTASCAKLSGAEGDEYPSHTVEMIVPYPAGGGTDTIARTLADIVNERGDLGSRVEIVNVDGGAGTVGAGKVFNAQNDGYTIGFMPDGPLALNPHVNEVSYDPTAYTPIVIPTVTPVLIAVDNDSPYRTLDDLLEASEKDPGRVTLGEGPLNYSAPADLLEAAADVSFKRIALEGDAASTTALLGGNLDATLTQLTGIQGQVKAGEIRILASTASTPDEILLPGVPTLIDSGYDVVWEAYTFVMAPAGLDADVASVLTEAFTSAVASDDFAEAVHTLGIARVEDVSGDDAGVTIQEKSDAGAAALGVDE